MINKLLTKLQINILVSCILIMRFLRQIYLKKHVNIYIFDNEKPLKKINPKIESKIEEIKDLSDLEKYKRNISPIDFVKFNNFLIHGCIGYFNTKDGKLLSMGWLADPKRYIHSPYLKVLFKNYNNKKCYYIFYCHTFKQYRGKNLYSHILSHIINKHQNEDIFIDADISNTSSQKGIEKVGFKFIYSLKYLKIFGIGIYVKKEYIKNEEKIK